ncbi:hypothetical protein BS636_10040 [Acinetobacter sp. LoGeW2-3]|uniref:hypothetical protein n=1 Tax=Acinetobacter sp. LoGeW2-3 TaxID=1808001 RepID=UPI000C05B735|nr:hypothetical protein [Acinetobacter sp. LoGeW2-3]ATO19968.1 hypothetical protein BS636_10040 [Acinetobacter sp. LoGeW2-3]
MNTLTIPQIFSQLSFYQENYLDIIQDATQYFTPVADAKIRLWPLAAKQLYLGDLLQLWFAEKWLVEQERQFSFEVFLNAPEPQPKDLYIYAISGNLLTGSNQSRVWQASVEQIQSLSVANVSKHYFEYQALTQPQLVKAPQTKWGVL